MAICGVDFGTSNSTIATITGDSSRLLALEGDNSTLPSVVFFNAEENSVCYGRAAVAEYLDGYEGRLMRSLKSLLGTSLLVGQTEVNGRAIKYTDLLSSFIGEMHKRGSAQLGSTLDHAVFGRPVFFIDENAEADRQAELALESIAKQAGFKEILFQYEPIAAAMDYESTIAGEQLVLVVDIGGGTSDFTVIRLSPEARQRIDRRQDILANDGVHIGGTDFDKHLSLATVMPEFGYRSRLKNNAEVPSSSFFNLATWHTINLAYTRKNLSDLQGIYTDALDKPKLDRLFSVISQRLGHWVAMQVEACKIELSTAPLAELQLDEIESAFVLPVARELFQDSISALVGKIGNTVTKVLSDAGIEAAQIDTVFFTGGASAVPFLREEVGRIVPLASKVQGDLHGSIGKGLAWDAMRRFA